MLILIRPHVGDLSVRRAGHGKSQHIARKMLESFAIRHTDSDLHDVVDCCHGGFSFRKNVRQRRMSPVNRSKRSVVQSFNAVQLFRLSQWVAQANLFQDI